MSERIFRKLNIATIETRAQQLAEREKWLDAARELLRAPLEPKRALQISQWQRRAREFEAAQSTLCAALSWCGAQSTLCGEASSSEITSAHEMALREALAETLLEAQNWEACCVACGEILELQPRHHFAREILATALLHAGEIEAAISTMHELLKLSPRDPLHRIKLATLLQLQGRSGQALREYERVAASYPGSSFASEAEEAIEALDRLQTEQILVRASEQAMFGLHLRRDFDGALYEGEFHLSENGRESLRHMMWDGRPDEDESANAPRVH